MASFLVGSFFEILRRQGGHNLSAFRPAGTAGVEIHFRHRPFSSHDIKAEHDEVDMRLETATV
jgi:hypothetical protein